MSTAFMRYGYGGKTSVASDIANYVETRLRDLISEVDRDDRFRVYGVPGEGYVEITALTARKDLENEIKEVLPAIERELRQSGVATAMFARIEPRVPNGAYQEVWRWLDQEVERSAGFIQMAKTESQGGQYEWQDWGDCQCDVKSDGTWGGHLRMVVAFNIDEPSNFFQRQFEADVAGTISRDGDIEGSFTNWTSVKAPPE